jgi:hypothetical protein
MPPVRGKLSGTFYGQAQGRVGPVRIAPVPRESAALKENDQDRHQDHE